MKKLVWHSRLIYLGIDGEREDSLLKSKGFTLVELIIVTALIGILAGVVAFTFAVGLKTWSSGLDRTDIRQDGNLVLERMVRELSQAYSIRNAEEDAITFWADADGDEEVTFELENSNLKRTSDGGETVLTPDVETFALSYRDVNNNLMTLPQDVASQSKRDNIRVIIILLTLDKADETVTLSSSVYTRNQGL